MEGEVLCSACGWRFSASPTAKSPSDTTRAPIDDSFRPYPGPPRPISVSVDDYRLGRGAAARRWVAHLEVGCLGIIGGLAGLLIGGAIGNFVSGGNIFAAIAIAPFLGLIGFFGGFYITLKVISLT